MRKTIDATTEVVQNVMSQFIPPEGQLINPFKAKKRENKQVTLHDLLDKKATNTLSKDPNQWTNKQMVEYFARAYQTATGGNYKVTYVSDVPIIKSIGDFMASNGLQRNEWTKNLIDWSLEHSEDIKKRYGYITLNSVFNAINLFYQSVVLPRVEEDTVERDILDTSLLEEIKQAEAAGKATEIFARYGLPVTITYLHCIKGYALDKIIKATEDRLEALSKGSAADREIIQRIMTSSVIGSPYPPTFFGIDWRQKFSTYCKQFHSETWWRQEDYKGKPLPKYKLICCKEE